MPGAGHRGAADRRAGRTCRPSRVEAGRRASSARSGPRRGSTSFCCGGERGSARSRAACGEVGQPREDRAVDPPDGRRGADVDPAVALRVDADVVARARRTGSGAGPSSSGAPRYSVSSTSRNRSRAPVGDEELQPGPVAQPAVAVVAEDLDDAGPDLGDLVQRHPRAEALGEHRVGRQPAADPHVEARAVLGVHDADERDVVDLVGDVVARRAGDRGLELARQVGERRGRRCSGATISSIAGVPSMISSAATPATGEPRTTRGRVAARLGACSGRRPRAAARSPGRPRSGSSAAGCSAGR